MEQPLEQILNLLLEAERAGVAALDALLGEITPGALESAELQRELPRLLQTSREDEAATATQLELLIRTAGATPSTKTGPFAAKVAAAVSLRDRLQLLIRGEEWVARKVEEALALAPSGPIHDYLRQMANRHRFEVEWGRAELIRLMRIDSPEE